MQATRPASLAPPAAEASAQATSPAHLAKAALRRLAIDKLEPTPENYEHAYRMEAGGAAVAALLPERGQRLIERLAQRAFDGEAAGGAAAAAEFAQAVARGRWEVAERNLQNAPAPDASVIVALIERIVRGIDRGGRNWTQARKKDGLQRVLQGSRSDPRRLQQRLAQLLSSWETDVADVSPEGQGEAEAVALPGPAEALLAATQAALPQGAPGEWPRVLAPLGGSLQRALPASDEGVPHEVASALAALMLRLQAEGATKALVEELEALCGRAVQVLDHRHHLLGQLGGLCQELTASIADLAEDDSWAKGQCDAMRAKVDEGLTARGVRAVSELLRNTRERQSQIRAERAQARDSLKGLINRMLSELDELGSQTGNFHESVGRYADVIERADSLEGLAGVVREMVEESRTVQSLVRQTQSRLQEEHSRATGLTQRVSELETEMQRLSDEVCTDQLTQVANRRGLMQAFEAERARHERSGAPLAIGLLDIDNFKRLNDELGHGAGDEALKSLAVLVGKTLRPTDLVARYGGEEFVVLLPETPMDEAQAILTRLQRTLTGGLFMHDQKQVFVTFSAGVTAYRLPERIEDALERADEGMYEAKRTGKNRTCLV
ncbi:MAG: diguanylate cyclase [Burkholderiales bacterium]